MEKFFYKQFILYDEDLSFLFYFQGGVKNSVKMRVDRSLGFILVRRYIWSLFLRKVIGLLLFLCYF